ncbi:MAG: ABC transporter ATP-binding protein, partial [Clostridiales bacterium]|nr:ABC transporter ATP-binding protein [Clostridiales bacterium]
MKKINLKAMENDKGALKKLAPYLAGHRAALIVSVVLAAAAVILQLYVPVLFGDAIDQIVGEGRVDFAAMGVYLAQILTLAALSGICTYVMNLINNRMTFGIVQSIRSQAIRHIQKTPLSYLDAHSSGDIVSRVITDTDVLSDGLLLGFTQLFSGVMTIVVTLIFMFSKNLLVSLMVILLTPLSFLVARFISGRSYKLFRRQSEIRGRQTALIDEMIGGGKVVRAFGYEKRASDRFAEVNRELVETSSQAVFYSSLTNPCTRFVNSVIYALVALAGVLLIPGGALTVGGLSVLLAYANQYMKPFNDISSVVTELQNALACASRVFNLLEEPEETPDATGKLGEPRGEVAIEDVSFSYDAAHPLIEHFNLNARPGMRVAIVGPTGCGKTTLINLLMRFYDVNSGRICVDGAPI